VEIDTMHLAAHNNVNKENAEKYFPRDEHPIRSVSVSTKCQNVLLELLGERSNVGYLLTELSTHTWTEKYEYTHIFLIWSENRLGGCIASSMEEDTIDDWIEVSCRIFMDDVENPGSMVLSEITLKPPRAR